MRHLSCIGVIVLLVLPGCSRQTAPPDPPPAAKQTQPAPDQPPAQPAATDPAEQPADEPPADHVAAEPSSDPAEPATQPAEKPAQPRHEPTEPADDPASLADIQSLPPQQTRTLLVTRAVELPDHDRGVRAVAFAPDGRLVATLGNDFQIKLSDAQTGKIVREWAFGPFDPEKFSSLRSADFSPDGSLLAAGSDAEIKVFDVQTGEVRHHFTGEGATENKCLRFVPAGDRLLTQDSDAVSVWSLGDEGLQRRIPIKGFLADHFALTPDGRYLAAGGPDGAIDLFDVQTGQRVHRFAKAVEGSPSLAINADGSLLAIGDMDENLVLYDLKTKALRLRAEGNDCSAIAFSPDGLLAVGFYGITLFAIGDEQLHPVGSCDVRGATAVGQIAFSPDGSRMIATDQGHQRRGDLFALDWSREEKTLAWQEEPLRAVAASPDGKWLAWRDDRRLVLYSLAEQKVAATARLQETSALGPHRLDFSPDGQWLAVLLGKTFDELLQGRNPLQLYQLPDLAEKRQLAADLEPDDLCFTPDGKEMLLLDGYRSHRWNLASGQMEDDPSEIQAGRAQFVPGRPERLVTVRDNQLRVLRWPDGEELQSWHAGHDVHDSALAPDGSRVVTWSPGDRRAYVWDAESGKLAAEIAADAEGVLAAAFSPDGQWVLTTGKDLRLKIWSGEDWRLRGSCAAHPGLTIAIVPLPGTSTFFTAGHPRYDGKASLKQWDLARLLEVLPEPTEQPSPSPEAPLTGGKELFAFSDGDNNPFGFTDQGRALFYLGDDDHVHCYDLAGDRIRWSIEVGDPNWVEMSADGQWLAASYGEDLKALDNDNAVPGVVKIWDTSKQTVHQTLTLGTSVPERMSFSPDGGTLAVASGNVGFEAPGELTLWDVAGGRRTLVLPPEERRTTHVLFSPDGSLLAFGGFQSHLTVWDVKANQQLWRQKLAEQMEDLQFSPDGRWVAVCGGDFKYGKMEVFEAQTGRRQPLLADFNEEVVSLAFSPKGDLLVAACMNDRKEFGYRFWSLPEGKPLRLLLPDSPRWGIGLVRFSPDGSLLAASAFGPLSIWRLDHLLDDALQRQIQQVEDRKITVQYQGETLLLGFPYDEASDRGLADLPVLKLPFMLNLGSAEGVSDNGLAHLAKQKNLIGLDLSFNDTVTPDGLAQLEDLPLRWLDVQATSLHTSEAVAVLGRMASLEVLKLSVEADEEEKPIDLAPLGKLTKLRELEFSTLQCPGSQLAHLANLEALQRLVLDSSRLKDEDLQHLAGLKNLRELEITSYEDDFTGAGLALLAACQELRVLRLRGSRVGQGEGIAAVKQFARLRVLDIGDTSVSDAGLAAVAGLTELEAILLPEEITDAGLAHLAGLTRLRELNLSQRPITDAGLMHLAKLDALESLALYGVEGINGSGLAALEGAEKLAELDLSACRGLTDQGMASLARLSQLKKLSLPPQTTDAGLSHLSALVNLRELEIDESQITDAGLVHLAKLQALENLSVMDTGLTDAAVPHLAALKNLSTLSLEKTRITPQGKERIKQSYPEGHLLFIFGP